MADGDSELVLDPSGSGPMVLPAAPGNFSEAVQQPLTPGAASVKGPFEPLTPEELARERTRLNFEEARRKTVVGAAEAGMIKDRAEDSSSILPKDFGGALSAATSLVLNPAMFAGSFMADQDQAKDQLERIQNDQIAYKNMPSWQGAAEGAQALAGQLGGMLTSPENLAFGALRLPFRFASPILNSMVEQGAFFGATQGIAEAAKQPMEIKAGLRKEYDPVQVAWSVPVSFAFGAGLSAVGHGASAFYRKAKDSLEDFIIQHGRKILSPELKPSIEPEVPLTPPTTFAPPHLPEPPAQVPIDIPTAGLAAPAEGNVRLYRAPNAGDKESSKVAFSRENFPNATEYVDVPEAVADRWTEAGQHGQAERVYLPKAIAETRQPLPEPLKVEEKSVFDELPRYEQARAGAGEEPQTLTQFLRSRGGLKPDPELDAIYGGNKPDLIRKGGMSLDEAREAATEAGYFQRAAAGTPEESQGINRLLEGLTADDKGIGHYRIGEARPPSKKTDSELARISGDVNATLDEFNIPSGTKAEKRAYKDQRDRAIELVVKHDMDIDTAVERAIIEYGEHARAQAGKPRFDDQVEIPFDTGPAPREGGQAGRVGAEGGRVQPSESGRVLAASSEDAVKARVKGMERQGITAAPGEERPAAGIASANQAGTHPPLENLQNAMARLAKSVFGIEVRKGHVGPGAIGKYDPETLITRLANFGNDGFVTFMHEVAHDMRNIANMDPIFSRKLEAFINANEADLAAFSGDIGRGMGRDMQVDEGWAEFIAAYTTNRGYIGRTSPGLATRFETFLRNDKPELLQSLNDAATAYTKFEQAPSSQAVSSMMVSHHAIPEVEPGDPLQRGVLQRWGSKFYQAVVNAQNPLVIARNFLAREFEKKYGHLMDLPVFKDPAKIAQMYGRGASSKSLADLNYGLVDWETMQPFRSGPDAPIYNEIVEAAVRGPNGMPPQTAREFNSRWDAFNGYLAARWHRSLRAQMQNGEIALNRPPSPMSDGDAAIAIMEGERDNPGWAGLAEKVYALQKDLVQMEYKAGLRTKSDFDELMHPRNHEYVPFNREMTSISDGLFGRQGSLAQTKGLASLGRYRRQGSTRNILSPMETIAQRVAEVNNQVSENMVKTTLLDMIESVGGREGAMIAEIIPSGRVRAYDINIEENVYKTALANGWNRADAKTLANEVKMDIGGNLRAQMYVHDALAKGDPLTIFAWRGGERVAMRLPDTEFGRMMVNVFDGLGPEGYRKTMQASNILVTWLLQKPAQLLRFGATTTGTFQIKNMIRDNITQFMNVPEVGILGSIPLPIPLPHAVAFVPTRFIKGAVSLAKGDDVFKNYLMMEGIRGGAGASALRGREFMQEAERRALGFTKQIEIAADRAAIAAELSKQGVPRTLQLMTRAQTAAGAAKELVQMMEFSETSGRLALFRDVYNANIKMGRDHRYAAWDAGYKARDIVDYGRFGSRMEMSLRVIPFLNANIQGLDKFMRTVGTALGRVPRTVQEVEYQRMVATQLLVRGSMLTGISVAIYEMMKDDPIYQRLSERTRATNWVFKVPFITNGKFKMLGGGEVDAPEGLNGVYVTVPKPFEWAFAFNLAERAAEFAYLQDPNSAKKAFKSLGITFGMPGMFQAGLPALNQALSSNRDPFLEMPIVPEALRHLDPQFQSNSYTGSLYKGLAKVLAEYTPDGTRDVIKNVPFVGATLASPWSPMESQYALKSLLGDWPRELGGAFGLLRSLATGSPVDIDNVPMVRAFVRTKMAAGEPLQEIYNQVGQNNGRLTQAYATYSNLRKTDPAEAERYFSGLDDQQKQYTRLHLLSAGPEANGFHPSDRGKNIAGVTRDIREGLQTEAGMPRMSKPDQHIKLDPGRTEEMTRVLNEIAAVESRNSLIVQGNVGGYLNLPVVNTKPLYDVVKALSPEVYKELSERFAQKRVLPTEALQRFWPEMQKRLDVGIISTQDAFKSDVARIAKRAAAYGFEGGGRSSGRSVTGATGERVKRGKITAPIP